MYKRQRTDTIPWKKKRKGMYWSKDEEDHLINNFERFLIKAAKEHGRTNNAILCRIFKVYEEEDEEDDN